MEKRLKLHEKLSDILGSSNVYYQPPETIKLKYPCFIYERSANDEKFADDRPYIRDRKYKLTLITFDPDNEYVDQVDDLEFCNFRTSFVVDNLYHYIFDIYC